MKIPETRFKNKLILINKSEGKSNDNFRTNYNENDAKIDSEL